jgi:hypothetical protein
MTISVVFKKIANRNKIGSKAKRNLGKAEKVL